jgi:glutamate-1-semialdehyde 2,1-aminomutase
VDSSLIYWPLAGGALAVALYALRARVALSRAKHPSLAGHARLARAVASLVPHYTFDEARFFRADDAPDDVAAKRRRGFDRLAGGFREQFAESQRLTAEAAPRISDLQFTAAYRVPFPFSEHVRRHLPMGVFVAATEGNHLVDVDGNRLIDLTGSYGVNVFGHDFYKQCMDAAARRAGAIGAVLGPNHPVVTDNAKRLCEISGKDEVSFHMSGTEAVMQAVRLARYHTRRPRIVRFCGAYHGWWGDLQPGVGNPAPARDTYTLREMDERTLRVLATRRDIACVLVNPLQALHPNAAAPADSGLVDSARRANFDREAYADWLRRLRAVCSERGIVLVFDEVFVGFRLARGGAQEYFGVEADLVTYGKTVAGGFPIGVVCGRRDLMRRFRDDRPADVCFARGTFNSHPWVMAGMQEFLLRLDSPEVGAMYERANALWDVRASHLNARLSDADVPVRVANLASIWTTLYTQPSRYNWMLQYYLRAEGLALSWVGTGRLIFTLDCTDTRFADVADRFVRAARAMRDDGWWWAAPGTTNRSIRRRFAREMIGRYL